MRYGEHVDDEGFAMFFSTDLTTVILFFLFVVFALLSLRSFKLYERCRRGLIRRARRRFRSPRSTLIRLGVRFCLFFAATITLGVACFVSSFQCPGVETVMEQKNQCESTGMERNSDASFVFSADRARGERLVQVSDVSPSGESPDFVRNGQVVRIVSMPLIPARVSDFEKEGGAF